jgi:hypothetical protein
MRHRPLGRGSRHRRRGRVSRHTGGSILEVVAPSARMGPPLTESPGRCRGYERRRSGEPKRANTTAALRANTRAQSDGGNRERGIGCRARCNLLALTRFKERPAIERWPSEGTCTTRTETLGPSPLGRRHCRFETGASRAGNDCDAFCSAMERGQGWPSGNL